MYYIKFYEGNPVTLRCSLPFAVHCYSFLGRTQYTGIYYIHTVCLYNMLAKSLMQPAFCLPGPKQNTTHAEA